MKDDVRLCVRGKRKMDYGLWNFPARTDHLSVAHHPLSPVIKVGIQTPINKERKKINRTNKHTIVGLSPLTREETPEP